MFWAEYEKWIFLLYNSFLMGLLLKTITFLKGFLREKVSAKTGGSAERFDTVH
jgi:hypothetical protein